MINILTDMLDDMCKLIKNQLLSRKCRSARPAEANLKKLRDTHQASHQGINPPGAGCFTWPAGKSHRKFVDFFPAILLPIC